jgi:uncharacterized protein (DUF736 family)
MATKKVGSLWRAEDKSTPLTGVLDLGLGVYLKVQVTANTKKTGPKSPDYHVNAELKDFTAKTSPGVQQNNNEDEIPF